MKQIEELLRRVRSGEVSVEEGLAELRRRALLPVGDAALIDLDRRRRRGLPEVVYCAHKTPEAVREIFLRLAEEGEPALGTRAGPEHWRALEEVLPGATYEPIGRILFWPGPEGPQEPPEDGPYIAVVSAGSSDEPVLKEAEGTLRAFGQRFVTVKDAGVAGLQRILEHVETLRSASAAIVIAGMDGALPSVVAGLVPTPVIAVPTSAGYGASFGGLAPLLAMLNNCAGGAAVVNIDNGFGAAYAAALIARKVDEHERLRNRRVDSSPP